MWLDVKLRHTLYKAVMRNIVKMYLAPPYMATLPNNDSEVNSHSISASINGDLVVPNTSLEKRTFQWRATQTWNVLPVCLRRITSLVMFKSAYDIPVSMVLNE